MQRGVVAIPIVLFGAGCAATARVGPELRSVAGKPVLEAQATVGPGLGVADDGWQLTLPVALSFGGETARPHPEGAFETGMEFAAATANGFGVRGGPRVGAGLYGLPGAYFGVRVGPTYSLGEIESDEWTPTLTLEGLAAAGLGGKASGGMFGVALSFGWDRYGSFHLPHGRPLRDREGAPWRASAESSPARHAMPRSVRGLRVEVRERVGNAWLREGLDEYAAVGAFVKLALELGAVGAPRALVARAWLAAHDEVHHARLCFGLAARYTGQDVVPEAPPALAPRRDLSLPALALESWLDGYLGEGTSARLALERARRATEPVTRRALRRIAHDEAGHAELGKDIVRHCLRREPHATRTALRAFGHDTRFVSDSLEGASSFRLFADHGLFSQADVDQALAAVRRSGAYSALSKGPMSGAEPA